MTSLVHDLRFVLRTMAKRPGFTAVVVTALALGLGVNITVFGAVNALLLRPLAVARPETLAAVALGLREDLRNGPRLSYPDYVSIAGEGASGGRPGGSDEIFSELLATRFEQFAMNTTDVSNAVGAERAELIDTEMVTGNYFSMLGVPPLLGRTISAEEGKIPSDHRVVVLSYQFWKRRFGGDPDVVGRRIFFNSGALTVIGVMPESFRGTVLWLSGVSAWMPLAVQTWFSESNNDSWLTDRGRRDLRVLGRLRPGTSIAQASARLTVVARNLEVLHPTSNAGTAAAVMPEIEGRYGASYPSLRLGAVIALVIAGLVLTISCANVANLLLARAATRTKEIGIRLALGARRSRLIRQLLTESLVLAFIGGGLGLLVAVWFADFMQAFLPPMPYEYHLEFEPDLKTMLWAAGICFVAGLAFGALPAWRASRADVVSALKTDVGSQGQSMRRAGLRQVLVVAQIAVSIVVVVCGGLILRSVRKLEAVDLGYRPRNLVSAIVDPGMFIDNSLTDVLGQFFRDLDQRLEKVPGVRAASSARYMPLVNWSATVGPVIKDGEAPPPPHQGLSVGYNIVAPKYFATVGTDIVFGRDFDERERQGIPAVAIINRQLARQLYGSDQEALGKRFRVTGPTAPLLEVIGIVGDGRYASILEPPASFLYLPAEFPELNDARSTFRSVLISGESPRDLPAIAEALRSEVQRLDARVPVQSLMVGDEHLAPSLYQPRLAAQLALVLGLLALGLATMGIYSVMTYSVSQRTKEIGIRMALGGQIRDVLGLVMGQGLRLILVGVAVGSLAAIALARLLGSLLYGIGASDPVTFLGAVSLLAAVALLATLIPARRATKVDPLVALRYE